MVAQGWQRDNKASREKFRDDGYSRHLDHGDDSLVAYICQAYPVVHFKYVQFIDANKRLKENIPTVPSGGSGVWGRAQGQKPSSLSSTPDSASAAQPPRPQPQVPTRTSRLTRL